MCDDAQLELLLVSVIHLETLFKYCIVRVDMCHFKLGFYNIKPIILIIIFIVREYYIVRVDMCRNIKVLQYNIILPSETRFKVIPRFLLL